jgi:hypothetical protein
MEINAHPEELELVAALRLADSLAFSSSSISVYRKSFNLMK